MKYDVILAGVGGQGVLSVAAIIALGAMKDGLQVRQSEVHGMAQRGGAVQAHLRLSDGAISGDLIGKGSAHMLLSMEPLESLRYLEYLSPEGVLITSINPFKNISNYPDEQGLADTLASLPQARSLDAGALAKASGSSRATNMVMVGAAADDLPVKTDSLIEAIRELFASKGEEVVQINERAFDSGSKA